MRYEPGAAHILSCQLKNRSGEPIIDGTVSLYLLITEASTPVFENVWYKADDSYNSPEEAYATAALATGSTQGVWAVEVRAEAFVAGRKYRAYWVDSAGRGEPYIEEIEVETGGTAIKTETALILADTGTDGVVVATASKTGYALSATGLDTIATTAPTGVASTFREMMVQVWRRFFKKSTLTATELKTYADNGTSVLTTQSVSDDETTETQGAAS